MNHRVLLLFLAAIQGPSEPDAPRTLVPGERVAGSLAAYEGDGERPTSSFALIPEENGPVTVTLESLDFDARLRVEGPGGELVAADEDSGIESDARLTLELEAGKAYVLVVSSASLGGEFNLGVLAGEVPPLTGGELAEACVRWRARAVARALERGQRGAAADHLKELGDRERERARPREALDAYQRFLALATELGDPTRQGLAHGSLGQTLYRLRDPVGAREHLARWLELARDLGQPSWEESALRSLGVVHDALGDLASARECQEQRIALARERGDLVAQAGAQGSLGLVHYRLGDYPRAAEHHQQHLELARQLGLAPETARALGNLAIALMAMGEYQRAQEHLEEVLALARGLGDLARECLALGNLGIAHFSLGDLARAEELFEANLELARRLGDPVALGRALGNLGNVRSSRGDEERAVELYEQLLQLSRDRGDLEGEGSALGNLGLVHSKRGDFLLSLECQQRALELLRESGDLGKVEGALGNLGNLHAVLGDFDHARELQEQRLRLARELGLRAGEAKALASLGLISRNLGDQRRGAQYLEQSLALTRELGNPEDVALALGNLGNCYLTLGLLAQARECTEQSLHLGRSLGNPRTEAFALGNLGWIHHALGDLERARGCFEQQLELAREAGDRPLEATALGNLGDIQYALGEVAEASRSARAAVGLQRELGTQVGLVQALRSDARSALAIGDLGRIEAVLAEAERVLDGLTAGTLRGDEASGLRQRFAGLGRVAQDYVARRLGVEGGPREDGDLLTWGFTAAGRWKGRALLEGIAEHRSGARSREAIEVRRQRRDAAASHSAALERVSQAIQAGRPSSEIDALRAKARARGAEVEAWAARLREVSPRDAALDLAPEASPERIRATVLAPRDLLVEYVEGERRLYAYVLGPTRLDFLDLGSLQEIGAEVEAFLAGLRDPARLAPPAEVAARGAALHARLLAPALALAQGEVQALHLVPTGRLTALPFEALVVEGPAEPATDFSQLVFAIERHPISYGPSAPVLVELAATPPRPAGGRVLLLADPVYPGEAEPADPAAAAPAWLDAGGVRALPDLERLVRLPKTREEAFAIAQALVGLDDVAELALARLRRQRSGSLSSERVDLHLGREATRARLGGDLRAYAVVHLACHGFVDPEQPRRGGLALSPASEGEGWFTIQDALELDLDARLVVLSACETARGALRVGEGVESLARAFLHSGSRAVVASLWQVADWAAAETMQGFYAGALERGLPPADALREAKLDLRRSRALRGLGLEAAPQAGIEAGHPFFWAPFIHIGLPR